MINGYQSKLLDIYSKIREEENNLLKERKNTIKKYHPEILEIDEKKISMIRLPEELIAQVSTRIKGMNRKQLQVICYFLTYDGGDNND